MLQRIADLPGIDDRDLSSLVWFLQGAAVISAVARAPLDRPASAPRRVYQSYGMTEGIGLCAIRGDEWLQHPGSVGRGFRGTEIRILDPDGNELPAGRDRRDLHALARAAACSSTSAARRCRRARSTASPPAATSAGSNPRATCTSSTGAST